MIKEPKIVMLKMDEKTGSCGHTDGRTDPNYRKALLLKV